MKHCDRYRVTKQKVNQIGFPPKITFPVCEGSGRVPVEQAEAGRRGGGSCQQEEGECREGRREMGQGEGGSDGGKETGEEGGEAGHVPPGVEGQGHHDAGGGVSVQLPA